MRVAVMVVASGAKGRNQWSIDALEIRRIRYGGLGEPVQQPISSIFVGSVCRITLPFDLGIYHSDYF